MPFRENPVPLSVILVPFSVRLVPKKNEKSRIVPFLETIVPFKCSRRAVLRECAAGRALQNLRRQFHFERKAVPF